MSELNRFELSEIQRKTFTAAFGLFDKAKTGLIPVSDFPALFRSIGQNPTESDLQRLAVSLSEAGAVSFDIATFLAICASPDLKDIAKPELILESFRQFDKDATQTISIAQLRSILQLHGERLPKDLADSFVAYAVSTCDKDKSGLINYETLIGALFSKDPGVTWATD